MSVVHHLWKGRRVRVAGALDQVAVASPDEMAAIYELYWDLVYRRCYATLQDEEAALDTTQDVFLNALKSFEDIRHDIVRGLMDLARTLAYERRRRPAREVTLAHPRSAERGDDPAEIAERHDVLDAVWSGLSPVERRYLADKFAGFSFEEIARRNRRALGTVSSNLARAREHARRMREPMLPAVLGVAGWRRLTDLSRRLRSAAQSSSASAAAQPVQSLTLSLAVAGLLAGAAPGLTSPAVPASIGLPVIASLGGDVAAATRATNDAGPAAGHAATGLAAAPAAWSGHPSAKAGGAAVSSGLPLVSAEQETPEDTRIVSATPSPGYGQDHTIVALGRGQSCTCMVLLRSTDGGATWTSQAGPPDGDQVVLPPAYPSDARIFVGYASSAPGAVDYWTPGFGRAFYALPLPGGALALPAGFDSGDQRVIASAPNYLWSFDWTDDVVQPLVVDSEAETPAVAAPLGALSAGILAMTSAKAVAGTSLAGALSTSTDQPLWACPPAQPCQVIAEVPVAGATGLSASPAFARDDTLLAYSSTHVVISRDGGDSFAPVSLPPASKVVDVAVLGVPVDGSVPIWMLTQRQHGFALERAASIGGPWQEVDQGLAQISEGGGRLIPVASGRDIFLSASTGFVCTANNGLSWATRCPGV